MGKPAFQRNTTTRIMSAAPALRYVAFYHAEEERIGACMNDYKNRSFVYVLTADYHGEEHYIYVGKSKAQYARLINHLHKYAFDKIYLFECELDNLTACEAAVIQELTPLYNCNHNPLADRNRELLGIVNDGAKDRDAIHHDLAMQESYEATSLYGFALPGAVFRVVEQKAAEENCTCSELVQRILERTYKQEIAMQITTLQASETNLVLPKEYGAQYGKSCEQIKVYCRNRRLPGAVQVGRDWVLPRDTPFPEDHRRKDAR